MNFRFNKTKDFLKRTIPVGRSVLDYGPASELSWLMNGWGYVVKNTATDLDLVHRHLGFHYQTAFEVLEHLFAPFNLLESQYGEIVISVPLKVWYRRAHWNDKDPLDCHYHEFEIRQFNALLKRTGWTILLAETMTRPDRLRWGIRPLLRFFIWPSYYFVHIKKDPPNEN